MGKEKLIFNPQIDLSQVANGNKLRHVNRHLSGGSFLKELGLDLTKEGDQVPETDGVPRLFLVSEGKVTALGDKNIEVGSQQFWQEAAQGHLFAYPAGEKHPVQVQLRKPQDYSSTQLAFSAPIDPQNMPAMEEKHPRRPRWYHRLFPFGNNRRICQAYDRHVANQKEIQEAVHAIEEKYSGKRAQADLKAEKTAKDQLLKARAEEQLQSTLNEELESRQRNVDSTNIHITNGIRIYGPKPELRPELTRREDGDNDLTHKGLMYSQKEFSHLTDIDLKGAKVGGEIVTDREFAALALGASSDPKLGVEAKKVLGHPEVTIAGIVKAGYSQEEAEEIIAEGAREMYGRTLLISRSSTGQYFEKAVQPARLKAQEALAAYQAGNKEPMAEILARMVGSLGREATTSNTLGEDVFSQNQMAADAIAMMKRDKDLEILTKEKYTKHEQDFHKNHPQFPKPRTFEEQLESISQLQEMNKLRESSMRAKTALLDARIRKQPLEEADKQRYAKDILKYNVVSQRYTAEVIMAESIHPNELNKDYLAMQKEAEKIPLEEQMPGADNPQLMFMTGMASRVKPKPKVMNEVANSKRMEELDKSLDNLIQKEGLAQRSVEDLCESLARITDASKEYSGEKLADKLIAANPRPQKQGEDLQLQQNKVLGNQKEEVQKVEGPAEQAIL